MKRVVLDASAVMTLYDGRAGAEQVEELLLLAAGGKLELLMSVVNWGEAYAAVWRERGRGAAQKFLAEMAQLPIEIVNADAETTKAAAELKAQSKLHYTDCFAAALAIQAGAAVAASDPDFRLVEDRITLLFI